MVCLVQDGMEKNQGRCIIIMIKTILIDINIKMIIKIKIIKAIVINKI
jgi:hypothetical protein